VGIVVFKILVLGQHTLVGVLMRKGFVIGCFGIKGGIGVKRLLIIQKRW